MKKILAIIMVVCMMAGVLYVPALAAEPASDVVIRVSALTKDGKVMAIESSDYKNFADGWEAAVLLATNPDLMDQNHYERIVVDFYADWKADKEGKFGDSDLKGIQYDTILVPADTKMTVNLNGHTIDRGLGDKNENNGEVICVGDNADLIINGGKSGDPIVRADTEVKNVQLGTITGGNSDNGAGGIHIRDGAKVILNNVNIVGNVTDDDDGAGIAVYDGASLHMSGGGFINNRNHSFSRSYYKAKGGAIYVDDSTVELHNVLFRNNQFTYETGFGVAIYAYRSTVTLDECEVVDNGHWIEDKKLKGSFSTIHGYESKLVIKNTSFTANGSNETTDSFGNGNNMIEIDSSSLLLDTCTITKNYASNCCIYAGDGSEFNTVNVRSTTITDNGGCVFVGTKARFERCTLNHNNHQRAFFMNADDDPAVWEFVDCSMGDTKYENKEYAHFIDTNQPGGIGSLFGEGSLTMIVAFVALVASIASVVVNVTRLKRPASATASSPKADAEK